jgi:ribonuclease HI
MKNKYIKILNELKNQLPNSASLMSAITTIETAVSNHKWESESKEESSEKFPLPKEIVKGDNHFALFSDGACRGNPGPGSWGMMAQSSTGELIYHSSGVDTNTTNNRMELEGAIQALDHLIQYFSDNDLGDSTTVFLYSDSKYVVDGISKWVAGWKKRGWKKADNKTPENVEQWKRLDQLTNEFDNLKFLWVKGHAGHPQNEYCDQLANQALDALGL